MLDREIAYDAESSKRSATGGELIRWINSSARTPEELRSQGRPVTVTTPGATVTAIREFISMLVVFAARVFSDLVEFSRPAVPIIDAITQARMAAGFRAVAKSDEVAAGLLETSHATRLISPVRRLEHAAPIAYLGVPDNDDGYDFLMDHISIAPQDQSNIVDIYILPLVPTVTRFHLSAGLTISLNSILKGTQQMPILTYFLR